MNTRIVRLACLTVALPCLGACAPLLGLAGGGGSLLQIAIAFDRAKLVGDGISYLSTGKTISDHVLSMAVDADCRLINAVTESPICEHKFVSTPVASDDMLAGAEPDGFAEPPLQELAEVDREIGEPVAAPDGIEVAPEPPDATVVALAPDHVVSDSE